MDMVVIGFMRMGVTVFMSMHMVMMLVIVVMCMFMIMMLVIMVMCMFIMLNPNTVCSSNQLSRRKFIDLPGQIAGPESVIDIHYADAVGAGIQHGQQRR